MVNDLSVRVENANGSNNDIKTVAEKIRLALTPFEDVNDKKLDELIDAVDGYNAFLRNHPDIKDFDIRLLGTSDVVALPQAINDALDHMIEMSKAIRSLRAAVKHEQSLV
jgi:hypothetical protein